MVKKEKTKRAKRVLLCMHNFPPISGPRAFRWLNLVKALESRGWDIHVLTIKPSKNDGYYDKSLEKEIPKNIKIFRSFPGILYSLMHLKHNEGKGFGKTTIEWFPFGVLRGLGLVMKHDYDLILSSALPFAGHLVGFCLKIVKRCPWIADYGDPLSFNPLTSALKRKIGRFVEGGILHKVDGIIVPFEEMKTEFLHFFPYLKTKKIRAIGQGIPSRFNQIKKDCFQDKFVLSYLGSFYKDVHEPYEFFHALSHLKEEEEIKKDIKIIIAGNTKKKYIEFARDLGLENIIDFYGHVPFEKAVSVLKGSAVIVYIGGNRHDFHFPSKVVIYAASQKPILAIKQSKTDLGAKFIKNNKLGEVVANSQNDILKVILDFYNSWKSGALENAYRKMSPKELYWDNRGEELEGFLNEILKPESN